MSLSEKKKPLHTKAKRKMQYSIIIIINSMSLREEESAALMGRHENTQRTPTYTTTHTASTRPVSHLDTKNEHKNEHKIRPGTCFPQPTGENACMHTRARAHKHKLAGTDLMKFSLNPKPSVQPKP